MGKDLIIKEKNNFLNISQKSKYRFKEMGKSLVYAGISILGAGMSIFGLPAIGLPVFMGGFIESGQKFLNAVTPDSSAFEGSLFKFTRGFKYSDLNQSSILNPEEVTKMTKIFKRR